jgi:hypothetical protein
MKSIDEIMDEHSDYWDEPQWRELGWDSFCPECGNTVEVKTRVKSVGYVQEGDKVRCFTDGCDQDMYISIHEEGAVVNPIYNQEGGEVN